MTKTTSRNKAPQRLLKTAAAGLAFGLIAGGGAMSASAAEPAVAFNDAALKACVAQALGVDAGSMITQGQMASLGVLDCGGRGIADITPLSTATGLASLNIAANGISDLSAISNLTNLTELDVSFDYQGGDPEHGPSFNLAPIAGLKGLTKLDLSGNQLTDISLVSGLTNLTELDVSINSITDISPVSGLTNLTYLGAENQRVSLPVGPVLAGAPQVLPAVTSVDGKLVPVTLTADSSTAGKISNGSVTWSESGHLEWSSDVAVGQVAGSVFSGVFDGPGILPRYADPKTPSVKDPAPRTLTVAPPFEAATGVEDSAPSASGPLGLAALLGGLALIGSTFLRRRSGKA